MAEIAAASVTPDDAARFLQRAVRINQLAANDTGAGIAEGCQHGIEPATGYLGVIVQEQQVVASGASCSLVTGVDKDFVGGISNDSNALHS